ncbi:uncharacterized protein LOC129775931 isoform X3 [Toxorhynchites rutilus septentrionalis]|nr:uncharacterized protein LOC129775931 isoform X3 [Toxorhynchites rutilus septentrionalis]XP_055637191.1 uncharacterized protein LOC129775931 isoform X3 [Toxorhynchites rutilus septentrionalis]
MGSAAKTAHKYDEADISRCMELVTSKKWTLYAACKAYGIPQSTVRYRLSGKWTTKVRRGPCTVFTGEEEQNLVQYLITMEKKGFPVVKELLLHKVNTFFKTNARPNPFKNNVPGRKWLKGFLRRHREITFRTPETESSASSEVKEGDIRRWFSNLTSYLEENNLMSAASDATRIYNGDETPFFLHPQTKAVLVSRDSKNVYEGEHADGHKNITVMFSFGADGSVVPPGVVLPMQRLSVEVLRKFPREWGIGKSAKGSMDTTNFMLYIRNVFYPHLQTKKVQFPVLYFVHGHSSHTTAEVVDLCLELGIVLIALYPNTTQIAQLADVIFKPLKSALKIAVSEWRMVNGGDNLLLEHFPGVLQNAMSEGIKTTSVKNGFRVCGLFPFGPDIVDSTKNKKYDQEAKTHPSDDSVSKYDIAGQSSFEIKTEIADEDEQYGVVGTVENGQNVTSEPSLNVDTIHDFSIDSIDIKSEFECTSPQLQETGIESEVVCSKFNQQDVSASSEKFPTSHEVFIKVESNTFEALDNDSEESIKIYRDWDRTDDVPVQIDTQHPKKPPPGTRNEIKEQPPETPKKAINHKCENCKKSFFHRKSLVVHRTKVHGIEVDETQLPKRRPRVCTPKAMINYSCENCEKSFYHRGKLIAHRAEVHGIEDGDISFHHFTCDVCGKVYRCKNNFLYHMKTHKNERSFSCQYCERSFITMLQRDRHEQSHTKQYPFKCRFCDMGSASRKCIFAHEVRKHN